MNPEEEFDKWWRKEQATSLRFPGDKEIWLSAYRRGLTRAVQLLDEAHSKKIHGEVVLLDELRRAILTERDKEK